MMAKVVFSSHVALIEGKEYDGIGNSLRATLDPLVDEYYFVRNSMDGGLSSEVQKFQKGRIVQRQDLRVKKSPAPIRYVSEYFRTISHFSKSPRIDVFIGIDPLNALAAIRLKKKGKVKRAVFYTADYSPKRFNNLLLNWAYHAIDRYCVRHADEVWSVSSRIVDIRRKMGLSDQKNIFTPNVPPLAYDNFKNKKHNKYELITAGIIDKQLDSSGVIKAVAILAKDMPDLKLTIIGNGPEEKRLRELSQRLNISDRVEFTGRLPLRETLARISTAGIGLALYTGVWGFNYYGDSTKTREFFNFGLPVLSTDTHSTVDDIKKYKAGIIVDLKPEEYVSAIREIIDNYGLYSSASSKVGDEYSGIHIKHINRMLKG